MDRKEKGNVAEYRVVVELLKRGHYVSRPLIDNLKYDLIVDVYGVLFKVQVKGKYTTITKSVPIRTQYAKNRKYRINKKYNSTDFDILIILDVPNDAFYLYSAEELNTGRKGGMRSVVWLGDDSKKTGIPAITHLDNWGLLAELATKRTEENNRGYNSGADTSMATV